MYIETIELRDWKCFQHARFDFPVPTVEKPVVLIGAHNGGGKTSILEAIAFCLYGPEAMEYLGRASDDSKREPYHRWVARAVHEGAVIAGRNRALVDIIFRDARKRIKVRRWWSVNAKGSLSGEGFEVSEAKGNSPIFSSIEVPATSEEDKQIALRGFVERHILPVNLAQFFFFDGEEIKRLAERDALEQVRGGVEGLLGVRVLRDLIEDLAAVSNELKSEVARGTDPERVRTAEKEIADIESGLKDRTAKIEALDAELPQLEEEIQKLKADVDRLMAGVSLPVEELTEREASARGRLEGNRKNLHLTLGDELPLALPQSLVRALKSRLQQEEKLVRWDSQREEWRPRFQRLLASFFGLSTPELTPPLSDEQREAVKGRLESAWQSLFVPPPPDIADRIRHALLGSDARTEVIARLTTLTGMAIGPIRRCVNEIDAATEELTRIREQKQQLQEGTEAKRILDTLMQKSAQLEHRQTEREQWEREIEALKTQLRDKRAVIERAAHSRGARDREMKVAERAEQIRKTILDAITDLMPLHRLQLAERMTYHYARLTNKPDVFDRIEINSEMVSRILGKDGRDLTHLDFSAGENEIFALSLVAALKDVSMADLPVVIDTPLARLDKTHRSKVARNYVPEASKQVILLSTDTEFVGPTFDAIHDRVGRAFLVSNPTRKVATVEADRYFERL